MSYRVVRGLVRARVCDRPAGIPYTQARGAKAAGLRYERDLARGIIGAKHGQWFEYWDAKGLGHCQPDIIIRLPWGVLILEAKYTWTEEGHGQVERLYAPVVSKALELPAVGMVVCKVLTTGTPRNLVHSTMTEAVASALAGRRTVLHWLGANLGPLQTTPSPSHLAPSRALA